MNLSPIIILSAAATVGFVIFAFFEIFRNDNYRFSQRFQTYKNVPDLHDWEAKMAREQPRHDSPLFNYILDGLRSFAGEGYLNRIEKQLMQGDVQLRPLEFLLIKIFSASACYLVTTAANWGVPMAILLCGLGWLLPSMWVKRKTTRRINLFEGQLSDVLDLLVSSLRSGQGFMQALGAACGNAPYPSGKEFQRLLTEMRLGVPSERAMNGLLNRVPSQDLEMIVAAYIIQRSVGGPLSEVLENVGQTIRERAKIRGDISTLTAQGRMSGYVIGGLPFVLAILLYVINPQYIAILFQRTEGHVMIAIGLCMQTLGILTIRKIVNIEY